MAAGTAIAGEVGGGEHSHAVPLVGLTGAMGAGKSTALELMRQMGAAVLSTDSVVHQLYNCDRLRAKLVERWGEGIAPAGAIDRGLIAERIFGDEQERRWLEYTIWPLVGERMACWLALAREQLPPPPAAVVETPLLFESGMDRACDCTIAILADDRQIADRIADREHARSGERAARQLSGNEKAERATYVVRNDGSFEDLQQELSAVLAILAE